jgi:uncharacterized membrane protein
MCVCKYVYIYKFINVYINIYIHYRTDAEVAGEANTDLKELKDPQTDADRAPEPKWYIYVFVSYIYTYIYLHIYE